MGIPVELKLEENDGQHYLKALPISELNDYRVQLYKLENAPIIEPVTVKTNKNALDIELKAPIKGNGCVNALIYGHNLAIDFDKNEVRYEKIKMPLSLNSDYANVRVIIDRCSIEVYTDGGRYLLSDKLVCDYNLQYLTLSSDTKSKIDNLEIHILSKQKNRH